MEHDPMVNEGGQCQSCGLIDRHRRDCPCRKRRKPSVGNDAERRERTAQRLLDNFNAALAERAPARKTRAQIEEEITTAPKQYLLRDIPSDIHERATKRAEADGLPLRSVLIALMEAYADRGITMRLRARKSTPEARPAR